MSCALAVAMTNRLILELLLVLYLQLRTCTHQCGFCFNAHGCQLWHDLRQVACYEGQRQTSRDLEIQWQVNMLRTHINIRKRQIVNAKVCKALPVHWRNLNYTYIGRNLRMSKRISEACDKGPSLSWENLFITNTWTWIGCAWLLYNARWAGRFEFSYILHQCSGPRPCACHILFTLASFKVCVWRVVTLNQIVLEHTFCYWLCSL